MSDLYLTDKAVLVTGGARRLGRAIARALHGAGMRVAIHYHQSSAAALALAAEFDAVRPGSASTHGVDLLATGRLSGLVEAVIEAHGGLHVLVNNASSFYPTTVGETTEAQWNDLMGTNLKAPYFLSQAARPALCRSRGCVVNMVDIYGYRPLSGHAVYSMAKAALIMQTESLAKEFAPEVRVNAIAPGPILQASTPASSTSVGAAEVDGGGDREQPLLETPLERWGTVSEIAAAALFLVRDAGFTTGATLPVDGGRRVVGY